MFRFVLLASACGASALQLVDDEPAKALLVLGCSLDRNAIKDHCADKNLQTNKFLQMHWCFDQDINTRIGFIFHPGVGYHGDLKAPFHSSYINVYSTEEILEKYANFTARKMLKANPDLVVVDSSLWDLAVWRMVDAREAPQERVQQWCKHDLPTLMDKVSATFPTSRIAFRTAPTLTRHLKYMLSKFSREEIEMLYGCITSSTSDGKLFGKYEIIDYHAILEKLLEKNVPNLFKSDGYHPSSYPSALYVNKLLKAVGASPKDVPLPPQSHQRAPSGDASDEVDELDVSEDDLF